MPTSTFFVRNKNTQEHPFPKNLHLGLLQKIQGVILYILITDHSTHLFFLEGSIAYEKLLANFQENNITQKLVDEAWPYFKEYVESKPDPKVQMILLNIGFAWDYALNTLREFMIEGNKTLQLPIPQKIQKNLSRLDRIPSFQALETITSIVGDSGILPEETDSICELSLLRNLYAHKEWLIDSVYLENTKIRGLLLGQIRDLQFDELIDLYGKWISGMGKITNKISSFYKDFIDQKYG